VGSKARVITDAARVRPARSEVGLLHCNPAKARARLGWSPQVGLEEGLRRTADHLRASLADHRPGAYAV
jgi:nucleoside-diphosphate-sugar epimerase